MQTGYFFSDYFLTLHQDAAGEQAWLYHPNETHLSLSAYRSALTPELWRFYDPEGVWEAEDFLSLNDHEQRVVCLPFQALSSGQTVDFPANLLSNLYASNGLSAGNTVAEAQTQALSEILERWVKKCILTQNLCLPEVPDTVLARLPNVAHALERLKAHHLQVSVRDASLGGRFPVVNVTLFDPQSGRCFASFGAHPLFEVALERTVTEALQGRSLDHLDGFDVPIFDAEWVGSDENIENHFIDGSGWVHAHFIGDQADFAFYDWHHQPLPGLEAVETTQQQKAGLVHLIESQLQATVYATEDGYLGTPACRVVVPGVSEVLPLTEMVDNNQNQGRRLREALCDLVLEQGQLNPASGHLFLETLEALGFADHQGVASLIGLLPDPDSVWQTLKIIDLKVFVYLGCQEFPEALDALEEAEMFLNDPQLAHFYRALKFGLQARMQPELGVDTHQTQARLFGSSHALWVREHLDGQVFMLGLPVGLAAFTQSSRHQSLLETQRRLRVFQNKASIYQA